ncbi:hypothetical protein F5Y08DRAFT_312760 [Xylaria arbuscula]|nr:hypothetical protein F5Y08DRAFT_312760 [Xylaria arbuscula]
MVVEDNPFVRFKNHIDNNLRRGWDVLVGPFVFPPASSPSNESSSTTTTSTTPIPTTPTSTSTPKPNSAAKSSSSSTLSKWFSKMPDTDAASDKASTAAGSKQRALSTSTAPTSPITTSTAISLPPDDNSDPPTMDDVHSWALHSPYSPLNLQHLRQPRPNDAPPACEGTFTFNDAFEDLLVTGSGAPLTLSSRTAAWKKCLFSTGLSGRAEKEPDWRRLRKWLGNDGANSLQALDWACGLGARGLWEAYFPVVTTTANVDSRPAYRDDWERFKARKSMRLVFPGWSVDVDDDDVDVNVDARGWPAGTWRAGAYGSEDSRSAWERTWRRGWGIDDDDEEDGEGRREDRRRRPVDFEDELYRAFDSAFFRPDPKREKSLRVTTHLGDEDATSSSEPESTTTTTYVDGTKLVRKIERTERDGKVEVTTTENYYDAQGNLLSESRGVSKTRSWSGSLPGGNAGASVSWSWNSSGSGSGSNRDEDGSGAEGGAEKKDKNGWFWKR